MTIIWDFRDISTQLDKKLTAHKWTARKLLRYTSGKLLCPGGYMIFYDLTVLYNTLVATEKKLCADMSAQRYHNIYRKKKGNKVYYYSVNQVNLKPSLSIISKEEYVELMSANIRFRRVRSAVKELDILIRFFGKRIAQYRKMVQKEYEELSYAASMTGPNKPTPFREGTRKLKTKRGDMVRSKSEQAIADALYDNGVDYEYESRNWSLRYSPDFVIFDSIRGRTVIWEHFGMMSDPGYVAETIEKINYYESKGFMLGDNFIATFELYMQTTDGDPDRSDPYRFDSARADEIVKRYFTPYVFRDTA